MTSPSTRSSTSNSSSKIESREVNIDKDKAKDLCLPVSRIRSIMKHAEDTQNISQDSIHVMTKVAELFLRHVARGAYEKGGQNKRLEYKHVAEYVQTNTPLTFMREILPRKITFQEYKEIMKSKGIVINPESEEGSSEEETSGNGSSGDDDSADSASTSSEPAQEDS